MNIKGAIFDLDGTLIDSLFFWDRLWEKLGENYLSDKSFRPGPEMEKAVRTVTFRDASEMLFNTFSFGSGPEEICELMHDFCLEVYRTEVSFKPGAQELLDRLKERNIPMCIASASMPDLLRAVVDRFGLDAYFPKVVSCAEVGKGKSHPDVFIAAQNYMGTEREATWVFEDSFVSLQTAANAGFPTVGIYDRHNFDVSRVEAVSTEYIGKDDSFLRLLDSL